MLWCHPLGCWIIARLAWSFLFLTDDIVQEAGIKIIPKEKKCKKAKWLFEEVLQTAVKRKVKGKGEKKIYTHLMQTFKK